GADMGMIQRRYRPHLPFKTSDKLLIADFYGHTSTQTSIASPEHLPHSARSDCADNLVWSERCSRINQHGEWGGLYSIYLTTPKDNDRTVPERPNALAIMNLSIQNPLS